MIHPLRTLFKFLLFVAILLPAPALKAQDAMGGNQYTTQDEPVEEKKKKKKQSEVDFFTLGFEKLTASFFSRMIIDIFSILILIRLIYYPIYHKKDFFFTFFLFNIVIFIITYLLNKVDLSMGAAFGLFAVFSLLRYRTENISAKDMTYLFIVIALGMISAVNKGTFLETAVINGIILIVAYAMDGNLFMKNENTKKIHYENIELIQPKNNLQLIEDLKTRTGLNIHKVIVEQIDFVKDSAVVIIHYYDND